MLLTGDGEYLFFGSGHPNNPTQINKFSVNKEEVVAKFQHPFFKKGITGMALSPDSNSLYIGTYNKLHQFCLKDGKVIQSRNTYQHPGMMAARIAAMIVTSDSQYLVTGTIYSALPEKGSEEDLLGELVPVGGPICVWSTKDLTLVKT
jgi:hypothetical protein